MNKALDTLCAAVKKIAESLPASAASHSFVIVTGKKRQGKTALLGQSSLKPFKGELDHGAHFYYNSEGMVLELGEEWLQQSDYLLTDICKALNRCHKALRISGIVLCVDSAELLMAEPSQLHDLCKSHAQLLLRFGNALGYLVETSIIVTKVDSLVGFSEFFQSEHESELDKPLGFSLNMGKNHERQKLLSKYQRQSDKMIEILGQQIIKKLHPARSGAKRTLIREFPLQLASLRVPIQYLLQDLHHPYLHLESVYFSSAEQGGQSIDKLNKKIQHEYALTVRDTFPQSHNYRPYFIKGALLAFQQHTQFFPKKPQYQQKTKLMGAGLLAALSLAYLGYRHVQTTSLLDETSKELLSYETLLNQNDKAGALYHLSLAEMKMRLVPAHFYPHSAIQQISLKLKDNAISKLHTFFLPDLMQALEQTMQAPQQTPFARYQALKIYLMLAEPLHSNPAEILAWFKETWGKSHAQLSEDKALVLLERVIKNPLKTMALNGPLITETRNYLNALPTAYFYYALAKEHFPKKPGLPIDVQGFEISVKEIPFYYTREGFQAIIGRLPEVTAILEQENWVLARQDLKLLQEQLQEAYCFEYLTWWKNFIEHSQPKHYKNYTDAQTLTETLHQSNAISRLIHLIQHNTKPGASEDFALFNKNIAKEFTALNLLSQSASRELTQNVYELQKFINTLALVQDHKSTVFELTKSRFQETSPSDPLSVLFNRANQLPKPISQWAKQIADDCWFIFINESREHINSAWQAMVYQTYAQSIAHRYPIDAAQKEDMRLQDFDLFFAPSGLLNTFVNQNIKPFLNTSNPEWRPKEVNGYVLPFSNNLINELIRANVIGNMFFPEDAKHSKIEFTLQKISLDPVVASLQLTLGKTALLDNQDTDSDTFFTWPMENAKLSLKSIDGNHFDLEENGTWAFFKLLEKVNVLVDNDDSASLQVLFEINGNSGRYLLKTQNQINPFSPGILTGFHLEKVVV